MGLAVADLLMLGVLGLSVLVGFWRGLVQELLSLVGWVLGFFVAQWLAADVAMRLSVLKGASQGLQHAAGFALVFVAVVLLTALAAWVLRKVLQAVGLGLPDRALGALFGGFRGVLALMVATVVIQLLDLTQQAWWQAAVGRPWLEMLLRGLRPLWPQALQQWLP